MKNTLLILLLFVSVNFLLSCNSKTDSNYYTGLKVFKDFDIHEDFSSLPALAMIADTSLKNIDSGRHQIITKLTVTFFDQYLKRSGDSVKKIIDQLVADKPGFVSTGYPAK